jgi:hypothetical protein
MSLSMTIRGNKLVRLSIELLSFHSHTFSNVVLLDQGYVQSRLIQILIPLKLLKFVNIIYDWPIMLVDLRFSTQFH